MGEQYPEVEFSRANLHRKAAAFNTSADYLDNLLTQQGDDDPIVDAWLVEVHTTFSELETS